MAPTGRKSRRTTTTTTTTRRATTRTLDKQRQRKVQSTKQEATTVPCNSSITTAASNDNDHPPKLEGLDFDSVVDDTMTSTSTSGCSTPKAQRFRIPEIHTCPPAPMKKRIITNCRLRRPIVFFAPPDLEVFFLFALGDVSV